MIKRAKKRRATASTQCNERSSRSHSGNNLQYKSCTPLQNFPYPKPHFLAANDYIFSVFILNIVGYNERTDSKISRCLNLVDLAGSERVKDSGTTGQRFEEAKKINGSLSCLKTGDFRYLRSVSNIIYII